MDFDFSAIENNIKNAEEFKTKNKNKVETRSSPGMKPLKFEQNPNYSPLKARIIDEINAQNKVHKDLYDFCTMRHPDNDPVAGMREANGIINGLSRNSGFTDKTLLFLLDFLGLEIKFIKHEDTYDDINEEDE